MFGIIYNPVSGGGKGSDLARKVESALLARQETCRLYVSAGAGDPGIKAEQAIQEGCTALVCLGGDGTLSEVVGAAVAGEVPLYIVPSGTGNDFARALKLPKDPMEAFLCQLDSKPVPIDCGRLNGKCFINVSGTGFDVAVLEKTEELKAIYPGEKAYHKALMAVLSEYKPLEAMVSIDDGPFEEQLISIVEVANGQYFGGGMKVAPQADYRDGLFDLIVIPKVPKLMLPLLLPFFLMGKHVKVGLAKRIMARKVVIRARNMTINIDGLLEKMDEATFEILPGALLLALPDGPTAVSCGK